MGMGGVIGGALTGGSPAGVAMGSVSGVVVGDLVSRALMHPFGRKMLMAVLDRGPFLDHSAVAALAVGINAGLKANPMDTGEPVKIGRGLPTDTP